MGQRLETNLSTTMNTNDNNTSTAFEILRSFEGDAAYDILNEHIEDVMKSDHPEFDELDGAEKELLWQEYLNKYTGAAADELLPECLEPRKFTLREDNAGGMLLTVTEAGRRFMALSDNAEAMSEYLEALLDGAGLLSMQSLAWSDEVDEEELDLYERKWAKMPVIADEAGVYADRAGVAGSKTLQLAGLRKNVLATLDACSTAEEVRDLVTEHDGIIWPDKGYSPEKAYRLHDLTWKICRIVYHKIKPETYEEISTMVGCWNDICKALVGAEYIGIDCSATSGDAFDAVSFAEADTIMLTCERVNLRGIKPYNMTDSMARLIDGEVLVQSDYDRDGDSEWFYFKKREK